MRHKLFHIYGILIEKYVFSACKCWHFQSQNLGERTNEESNTTTKQTLQHFTLQWITKLGCYCTSQSFWWHSHRQTFIFKETPERILEGMARFSSQQAPVLRKTNKNEALKILCYIESTSFLLYVMQTLGWSIYQPMFYCFSRCL